MGPKFLLVTGIILLIIGILIKKMTQLEVLGLFLIIFGVICKATYIIKKARSGEYKPGKELYVLALGLLLFFTGLFLRNIDQTLIKPIYLIVSGITLKIVFIFRFIQISRAEKITRTN